MASRGPTSGGPVEAKIVEKLTTQLAPAHLAVINESFMHNVPRGSETHFKVFVVSEKFEGQTPLKKHRMVHDILDEELKSGVHALSIEAKTPSQWDGCSEVDRSPKCRGGFGK